MRITLPALVLGLAAATRLLAQDDAGLPVSKDRLFQALQYRAFTPDQILSRVEARGVDFEATDGEMKQFRLAGASPRLLAAIRARYQPIAEVKPHVSTGGDDILAGPPLSEREVVILLKAHVPADQVAHAVAGRGVDFALNKAFNQDIWGAGGNLTLMGEILLCSRSQEPPAQTSELFPVPDGPANSGQPKVIEAAAPKSQPKVVEAVAVRPAAPQPKVAEPVVAKSKPAPSYLPVSSMLPPSRPASAPTVPLTRQQPAPAPPPAPVYVPTPPPTPVVTSANPRRMEIDPALQATKLLVRVPPVYPSMNDHHTSGLVRLEVLIDTTGKVVNVKSLKGDPRLVAAAESAVRRWTYRPTVIGSETVEVITQVEMIFSAKN